MHVLLLEDDLDLGQAIVTALRQDGCTVLWQRTPTAVEGLDRERIDAVLLDLGLPRIDGMDLLRPHPLFRPWFCLSSKSGLNLALRT